MHSVVFTVGAVWMAVLLGASAVMLVRARSLLSRILSLDMLILIVIALLVLFGSEKALSFYLDAALALALLSFVATLVAARYRADRRPFS